jgi:hypothetical protein
MLQGLKGTMNFTLYKNSTVIQLMHLDGIIFLKCAVHSMNSQYNLETCIYQKMQDASLSRMNTQLDK